MLLIFDWDGTLSDSTHRIIQCLQQAAHATGVEVLEDEAICNIIGLGLPEAMQRLYPNLDHQQKERLRLSYIEYFLAEDQQPSAFFDGVSQGLQHLRDAGFLLAVATGKSRRGLDRVLENLEMQHYFDGSRCADETASKPHPMMLNELLNEFNIPAEQAIMVGDTEYDMEMAKQAGVGRIAVSYGAHHIDRLSPYQPLLQADKFHQIVDWLLLNDQMR